jgi:hypothetical protein
MSRAVDYLCFYCCVYFFDALLLSEKNKVAVIVDQVSRKAAEIGAVKDDAEKDLSAAKPALDEALSALNSITPKDIVSLKALKSPPDIVKRIFDAVLLLRHWPIDKASTVTVVLVATPEPPDIRRCSPLKKEAATSGISKGLLFERCSEDSMLCLVYSTSSAGDLSSHSAFCQLPVAGLLAGEQRGDGPQWQL